MSSSMRNFMEAYTAVHNTEAKEELNSQRDPISEMNTAKLKDNDLRDLAEEILEEVFKTSTVKEAEDIIYNMIPESNIVGREEKLERIYAAFGETFSRIKLKNQSKQMEEFAKYRQKKRLEETWSARYNQDKRVERIHSTVIAEDKAVIKNGLLDLFENKKNDPCWVGYKQVGTKMKGGKVVPNCVPANEAVEYEVDEAMRPGERQRKVAAKVHDPYATPRDRATAHNVAVRNDGPGTPGYEKKSTGGKGARFAGYGYQGAGNKARRRMGQEPLRGNTRKEEFVAEKKGSKPDYLDFDRDRDEKESMKKALKDKRKGMKEQLESTGKFTAKEIESIIEKL